MGASDDRCGGNERASGTFFIAPFQTDLSHRDTVYGGGGLFGSVRVVWVTLFLCKLDVHLANFVTERKFNVSTFCY